MATLERPSQLLEPASLIDAVGTSQGKQDEEVAVAAMSSLVLSPFSFPDVPSHDPRTTSSSHHVTMSEPKKSIQGSSADRNQYQHHSNMKNSAAGFEEDEIEEVLEELQDEVAMPPAMMYSKANKGFSDDQQNDQYLSDVPMEDMAILPLLITAQNVCLAIIEPLLQSIQANAPQAAMLGGPKVVETLIEASRSATSSTVNSPLIPVKSLAEMRDSAQNESLNRLIELLEQIPSTSSITRVVEKADHNDEVALLSSLQSLMISIDAARWTADLLDDQAEVLSSFEIVSLSNIHDPTSTKLTPSPHQQMKLGSNYRHYQPISASYPTSLSSPVFRREELRDPFADSIAVGQVSTALRSPSILSEDGRDVHSSTSYSNRLVMLLHDLDGRCITVLETIDNLPSVYQEERVRDSTLDASEEGKRQMKKTWLQLQAICKTTRAQLSTSSIVRSANLSTARWESSSPVSHTYHYSPTRTRSRKGSNASFNSLATSLHSLESGDPIGEATAAGVGMYATRSLSRLSTHSNHYNGQAILPPLSPLPSSLQMIRRGSTKSEHSTTQSIRSLPPRYSEDSARSWVAFNMASPVVATPNRANDTHIVTMRSRNGSEGGLSAFSTRILPAYDANDNTHHGLQHFTDHAIEKQNVSERSRSFSVGADYTSDKTLQDLKMIENSIDRLYNAVPQLEDQRAWSPNEYKKRNAQKQAEMFELLEKLSKGGRMEDQRVNSPTFSHPQFDRVSTSTNGQKGEIMNNGDSTLARGLGSGSTLTSNGRSLRRLGSITFGSLSLRRAASALGADGKGKGKARETESKGYNDIEKEGASSLVRNKSIDQHNVISRSPIKARFDLGRKLSNLDLKDVSNFSEEIVPAKNNDDHLFEVLTASMSGSRMANQDATKRASPIKRNTIKSISHNESLNQNISDQNIQSSLTPEIPKSTSSITRAGESPISRTTINEDRETDLTDRSNNGNMNSDEIKLQYIAESQPRLGSIPVLIWVEEQSASAISPLTLLYAVDTRDSSLLNVKYRDQDFTFALPRRAKESEIESFAMADWNENRWSFKLDMSETFNGGPFAHRGDLAPFSASTMQKLHPSRLICNGCSRSVAKIACVNYYLPLPSQHWEELIDAWMCHADQELNQEMIETQKKLENHRDIQIEQARISEDFLIIDSSLMDISNTYSEKNGRVRCQGCQSTIGTKAGSTAFKLYKYAFHLPSDDDLLKRDVLFSQVIASQLIRLSQAHSTRHFIIQDDNDSPKSHLKLWLFLDHFEIASNSSAYFGGKVSSMNACKIMFQDCHSTVLPQQSWSQPDLVEQLYYPHEICFKLKALLLQSSHCYPLKCRSFGKDWLIGFLPI